MGLTQLGSVYIDLDQVTAVSAIEAAPEDSEIFAFDVHIGGTVVPVVATNSLEAEQWRDLVIEELVDGVVFNSGGYMLDVDSVQAIGQMTELEGLDELHPDEASFDVYLDGTVAELFYDTVGEAAEAQSELIDEVNAALQEDGDEEDEEDE